MFHRAKYGQSWRNRANPVRNDSDYQTESERGKMKSAKWVIEFRNGSFFQNLEEDHGGTKESAQKFDSEKAAQTFMDTHQWIYTNGGMAVRY